MMLDVDKGLRTNKTNRKLKKKFDEEPQVHSVTPSHPLYQMKYDIQRMAHCKQHNFNTTKMINGENSEPAEDIDRATNAHSEMRQTWTHPTLPPYEQVLMYIYTHT
jgi:hypothetical protein